MWHNQIDEDSLQTCICLIRIKLAAFSAFTSECTGDERDRRIRAVWCPWFGLDLISTNDTNDDTDQINQIEHEQAKTTAKRFEVILLLSQH